MNPRFQAVQTADQLPALRQIGFTANRRLLSLAWTLKNVTYRYRVWRLEREGDSQWWGAWIHSSYSGVDYHVGDIRVSAENHQFFGGTLNFSEYWGPARDCDRVPVSYASLTQPAGNSHGDVGGLYQYYSRYHQDSFLRGHCTGGSVTKATWPHMQGVWLKLGGRR